MPKNRFEPGDKVIVTRPDTTGVPYESRGYVRRRSERDWLDKPQYEVFLPAFGSCPTYPESWITPDPQTYPEPIVYAWAENIGTMWKQEYRTWGGCQLVKGGPAPGPSLLEKAWYEAYQLAAFYAGRSWYTPEDGFRREYWVAIPKGFCFEYARVET